MACGTPVAGFNAGGLKELLNWEGDFGVDTKDVEKLAEKIVWAIKYPKECGEIGFKLQNKVKEIYSLEMQAQNYVKLYERLLHFN
jgi:glycosyltransferase involved in cell wall biosynthesis